MRLAHLLIFVVAFHVPYSQANPQFVNISIDDNFPDPLTGAQITYGLLNGTGPAGFGWNIGQNCTTCSAQPDASQAFDGTWHDTSTLLNGENIPVASVTFTGIAVYVMGIIVTSCPETTLSLNNSRLFFEIDGTLQGTYVNNATVGPEVIYSYNTTLFSKEDLPLGAHNITIGCGDGDPSIDSVCLIDRIIYSAQVDSTSTDAISRVPTVTTMSSTSSSPSLPTFTSQTSSRPGGKSSHLSMGVIVGIVMGSTSFLVLVAGAFFLLGRRNRNRISSREQNIMPYLNHNAQNITESRLGLAARPYSASVWDSEVDPPSYHAGMDYESLTLQSVSRAEASDNLSKATIGRS